MFLKNSRYADLPTESVPDPHGPYKKHPQEPRLMVAREPGEFGGAYFRVMPEGTLANHDGLTIQVNRDAEGLEALLTEKQRLAATRSRPQPGSS